MFNVKSETGYPDKITPLIYEVIGTAFLIIAVNWGAAMGPIQMSYAIGFTVFAMV